ncbi:MAG: ATP-binding protein [Oscillospiraceae bacterium]|nr:ATP-binding protein [Oscillospiraceae bacterium]
MSDESVAAGIKNQNDSKYNQEMSEALNKAAIIFLSQYGASVGDVMTAGMKHIAGVVDADRISIFRNSIKDGEPCASQIYCWLRESGGTFSPSPYELSVIAYSELPERWRTLLSEDSQVAGSLNTLPENEAALLRLRGSVSAFAAPVFINGDFWGFALFEDLRFRRIFSESMAETMRSAALLCANTVIRFEMMSEIEKALFDAKEANRVKSEFMSRMSHEMYTPMHAIIGMTQIAMKYTGDSGQLQKALSAIDKAAADLFRLIQDILDISGKKDKELKLDLSRFDFSVMMGEIIDETRAGAAPKEQTADFEIDPGIPAFLVGDKKLLKRVAGNILSNALKFTGRRGKIHTAVRRLEINGEDGSVVLQFEISDDGIGIPEEQQREIFSVFGQAEDGGLARRYGGAGLGLAVSRHIVEMMGGKIWVESEQGKGSKFAFTCKLNRSPQ